MENGISIFILKMEIYDTNFLRHYPQNHTIMISKNYFITMVTVVQMYCYSKNDQAVTYYVM